MKANHYIVKGIVQGVNFRYFTLKEAQKLGVTVLSEQEFLDFMKEI